MKTEFVYDLGDVYFTTSFASRSLFLRIACMIHLLSAIFENSNTRRLSLPIKINSDYENPFASS